MSPDCIIALHCITKSLWQKFCDSLSTLQTTQVSSLVYDFLLQEVHSFKFKAFAPAITQDTVTVIDEDDVYY